MCATPANIDSAQINKHRPRSGESTVGLPRKLTADTQDSQATDAV